MKRPPSLASQQRAVDAWNAENGETVDVIVTRDDGSEFQTKTRSVAWIMGGHSAVIMVNGIAGGIRLSRVRPLRTEAA